MKQLLSSATLGFRQPLLNPQTLIFFVTSRCNARCEFCLYKESVANPHAAREELRPEEVEKIAKSYGPLHYLAISGGEPFVRKDLPDIISPFIRFCKTRVVDIPSNFFYQDSMISSMKKLLEKNPTTLFDLQFSVDDIGELHDQSRRVKGLFRTAIESYRAMWNLKSKYRNLRLKVNVVYLNENKDRLDLIRKELASLIQFDRISLTFPQGPLPLAGNEKSLEDYRHYRKIADQWALSHTDSGLDIYSFAMKSTKTMYHSILEEAMSGRRNLGSLCRAGKNIVVINEVGDVFPCETLWKKIGNLRENQFDINEILGSEAYKEFTAKHLGENKCNCSWSCAALSAIAVSPRKLPEIAIKTTKQIFQHAVGRSE